MNIGVACGGRSSERNVSLKSGRAVHAALEMAGYKSKIFDIDPLTFSVQDFKGVDVVFVALHGEFGEDGQFQSLLQNAGIPYTGSGPEACRLAMDKLDFRNVLDQHRIQMPTLLTAGLREDIRIDQIVYPAFVKPAIGGSSIGVSKLLSKEDAGIAIEKAFKESSRILVEKAVEGREFAVGVLDGTALQPIEICTQRAYFDYEAKYSDPGTKYVFPQDLSETLILKMQQIALQVHNYLECRTLSRVDMIVRDEDVYVLELNAAPGMTERSLLPLEAQAANIQFAELCDIIVKSAIQNHKFAYE